MKKRIIALLLSSVMVLSMVACGTKEEAPAEDAAVEEVAEEAPEEEAAEPALDIIGTGAVTYDPNQPVNNGEDITLEFWYDNPGEGGYERYKNAIADYQEIHPNVTIEVNNSLGWGDYWQKLPVAVANGTGPDLMHFHNGYWSQFIPTSLVEAYPDDLTQALIEDYNGVTPYLVDGKAYSVPVGDSTGLIIYNKEMWAAAGLTDEDIPATWDELVEVAKTLTTYNEDGTVDCNGFLFGDYSLVEDIVYQSGYFMFTEDGETTQFNNEEIIESVQMLQDFYNVDKISSVGSGAVQERFANGKAAMFYTWTWIGSWLAANVGDSIEWGAFPVPTLTEDAPVVGRNNPEMSAVVSAYSSDEEKVVAMDFLRFYLATDAYQVELGLGTGTLPAKFSAQTDASLQENKVISTIAQYMDKTLWLGIVDNGFETHMGLMYDEIFVNNGSVSEALANLDAGMVQLAEEADYQAAERLSSLAEYLK